MWAYIQPIRCKLYCSEESDNEDNEQHKSYTQSCVIGSKEMWEVGDEVVDATDERDGYGDGEGRFR